MAEQWREVQRGDETLQFPRTMSDEEIEAIMQREYPAGASQGTPIAPIVPEKKPHVNGGGSSWEKAEEKKKAPPPWWRAVMGAADQGISQGTSDEIAGGIGALTGAMQGYPMKESFVEDRDASRAHYDELKEAYPKLYPAVEFGAGMLTGGAGLVGAAGKYALKKALPRLAGTGAGFGAASGAGYADEDRDPVTEGAVGAATGAATATGMPVMGHALRGLIRKINPFNQNVSAAKQLAKDLDQSSVSPHMAEQRFAGNPDLVTADLAPQLQQRLAKSATESPQVARDANALMRPRQATEAGRLDNQLTRSLPDIPTDEVRGAIQSRIRSQASTLYDEAYNTPIAPNDAMKAVLATDAGKSALKKALTQLRNQPGVKLPVSPGRDGKDIPDLRSVQLWDEIQRVLTDSSEVRKRAGKLNDSRVVGNLARTINDGLSERSTAYQAARQIWRGGKADQEALDFGAKALTENTPQLKAAVAKMSESEKYSFRAGVLDKLRDMISKKPEGSSLSKMFGSPKARDAIKITFDDDKAYRKFMNSLDDEAAMSATLGMVASKWMIDVPPSYGASLTPYSQTQAAFRGVRELLHRGIVAPTQKKRAEAMGGALLGRNPGKLLQQGGIVPGGTRLGGAAAAGAGVALPPGAGTPGSEYWNQAGGA